MREIKFRGRRVDNGEWVEGDLRHIFNGVDYNLHIVDNSDGRNNDVCGLQVIPETVGQFTGLKDKYGDEIYEGDIVRTADGNVVATIKNGECCPAPVKAFCKLHGVENHKIYCLHAYDKNGEYLIENNKSLEIIGDMFGNPELLEENNENNNN